MKLRIEKALKQGVAAHKAGQLHEAEHFYRAILQSEPRHPEANHNLGMVAVSVNKCHEALPLLKRALESNPNKEQFWVSYISVLIKEKHLEKAKQVFEQAKKHGVDGQKLNSIKKKILLKTQHLNKEITNPPQEILTKLMGVIKVDAMMILRDLQHLLLNNFRIIHSHGKRLVLFLSKSAKLKSHCL